MIDRELLVLACGRSGTLYTSKVFRAAGFDLRHEQIGAFGSSSMYMVPRVTDCSIVNAGQKVPIHAGENRADYRFKHVWHQTRHPLRAIDSLAKSFTRKVRLWTGEQIRFAMPGRSTELQCPIEDKIHWAMRYWFYNNAFCGVQAEWRYQLENFPWGEMLERLGYQSGHPLPVIPATTNRNLRFAFKSAEQAAMIRETIYDTTWETLERINPYLTDTIRRMARRYGYE